MSHAQNRLFSIRTTAIIQSIAGVVGFLWTCMGLINLLMALRPVSGVSAVSVAAGIGEFLVPFSLSLGQLVMGFGLLKIRRWSWFGALILQVIVLLDGLLSIQHVSVPQLINLVIAIILFGRLVQSDTRSAFLNRVSP